VEKPIEPSIVKGTPAFEALYVHQKWVATQVSMTEALIHYRKDGGNALQPVTVSTSAASCMNVLRMAVTQGAIPGGEQHPGYSTYVADLANYQTVRPLATAVQLLFSGRHDPCHHFSRPLGSPMRRIEERTRQPGEHSQGAPRTNAASRRTGVGRTDGKHGCNGDEDPVGTDSTRTCCSAVVAVTPSGECKEIQ
jgi:hypothetical protein